MIRLIAVLLLSFRLLLFGASPWDKPAGQWTQADCRTLTSNSPWSKQIDPALVGGKGRAADAVIVRWESALPVRLALDQLGLIRLPDVPGSYLITVSLPPDSADAAVIQDLLSRSAVTARLKIRGRKSIEMTESRMFRRDRSVVLAFRFPAVEFLEEPKVRFPFGLTPTPPTADFLAEIGMLRIQQRFSMRAMRFQGKGQY